MKSSNQDELAQSEHYQEMSSILRKAYENSCQIPLHIQIDQISQWVESDHLEPLLITSDKQGGKKTLLCQFIRYYESQEKPKTILISQFASISPYFSEILYRIMMHLRTILDIQQKVELNEQRLRQYFRYWLEVADQKIQKEYLSYSKEDKMKILIIIEGIDKVVDAKGTPISPNFWLPYISFQNIKFIFTADVQSPITDSLNGKTSDHIQFVIEPEKIQKFKEELSSKDSRMKNLREQTHIEDLKFIAKIIKLFPEMKINQGLSSFDFLKTYIKHVSNDILGQNSIINILTLLKFSKKGLSKITIRRTLKLSQASMDYFLKYFNDLILKINEKYLIISERMKNYIDQLISEKSQSHQTVNMSKIIHASIAKSLKKDVLNVNNLEQTIHHLIGSQNSTQLKEILSRTENFLVLYTPLTKHLLCMCWLHLQLKFQYDPVFQYNKAIERFLNHYYPSTEDTFKIIFQLCLFFKEYSQFENYKTPQFRHPPIRGQIDHLRQITISEELIKMGMYQKCKQRNKQNLQLSNKLTISKISATEVGENTSKSIKKVQNTKTDEIRSVRQSAEAEPKQAQKLNVKIKFHQQKFKAEYLSEMEQYINQFYVPRKKQLMNNKDRLLDEDSDDSETELEQNKIDIEKIKKSLILKKFTDYCEEIYHRFNHKRSFYYYKQWIWMQFPWISESLKQHYSKSIESCMKNPTQYMSIEKESRLIMDAVKIAKIAKKNKEEIYENKLNTSGDKRKQQNFDKTKDYQSPKQIGSLAKKSKLVQSKIQKNISFIEDELKKYAKESQVKKSPQKYNSNTFLTDSSPIFNSYIDQKENNLDKSYRLPCIFQSKISQRSPKKMKVTEDSRSYGILISRVNQLKHQNSKLAEDIEQIKMNQQSLKVNSKQRQKQILNAKIQQLKNENKKIINKLETQKSLKQRLQMIIKLCDINKSHGSESADLHSFSDSIKFMINLQQSNIQSINIETKKILEEKKNKYKSLKESKNNLIQQLKKETNKLCQLQKKNQITFVEEPESPKLLKGRKKSKFQSALKIKLEKQQQELVALQKYMLENLQIDLSKDIENGSLHESYINQIQRKVKYFQEQMNKKKELQWKLHEICSQNVSKQAELNRLTEKVQIAQGYPKHCQEAKIRSQQRQIKQENKKMIERKKCLKQCINLVRIQNNQIAST